MIDTDPKDIGAIRPRRTKIIPVLGVRLVREDSIRVPVYDANNVARIADEFISDRATEHFLAFAMNNRDQVTGVHVVASGTMDNCIVHPREVFRFALLVMAKYLIVAHNHPSGDIRPSHDDVNLTRKFIEAGKLLAIPVTDHVIVGENGDWFSMRHLDTIDWGIRR